MKSGIELGDGIGEIGDLSVACAEFVVVWEHIRETGGVGEQVPERDGSQCAATEGWQECSNGFVEPETAFCGELYGDERGDGFGK